MVGTAPTLDGVIYRNQTEAPTEAGWYYGKQVADNSIQCYYLLSLDLWGKGHELFLDIVSDSVRLSDRHDFAWFGPVAICREG